jgi:catechol 2,3-dioxygenase-like lactoylglutathione lyase family enzyme
MASSTSPSSSENKFELVPILRVASASAAVEWYAKLGFKQNWVHRFEPTLPAFVEISNANMKLFLSEHRGDASPDTLLYITVPDVDAFVTKLEGVTPEDVPELGLRDCEVKDPDGNRLRIGSRIGQGEGYDAA